MLEAPENEQAPRASSSAVAAASPVVAIPATRLVSGSTPGDRGRNATLEPALVPVELGAFDIDRGLYPNEPGKRPLFGVPRARAAELCAARSRRLCSELEWEAACKGPEGAMFAGGDAWDPACAGSTCASGFGVVGMGSVREWTASQVAGAGDEGKSAAVRGAPKSASDADRRCARRSVVSPDVEDSDLGFRCCGGEPNTQAIAPPSKAPNFEGATLPARDLAELLAGSKELSRLGKDLKYFDLEASPREVVRKSDAGEPKGYELTTLPLAWRPAAGEDLVVVTGLAGEDSFIVALYKLPDGRFRVASSLVLKKDPGPVVLAYDKSVDTRLEWATCFQCPGESGRISYRDDRRVVITQE